MGNWRNEPVIYLDARGSNDFRDMLFELVVKGRNRDMGAQPAVPITRETLDQYDTFTLFRMFAKQAKPSSWIPKTTGREEPIAYNYPTKLPPEMERSGFGFTEYAEAIDHLLNGEHRELGYTRRTPRGTQTHGTTPVHTLHTEVLKNLLTWIGNHIEGPAIKLPKETIAVPSPAKRSKTISSARIYADEDGALKAAFCAGIGADPESVGEAFLPLFQRIVRQSRLCVVAKFSAGMRKDIDGKGAEGPDGRHTLRLFGTDVFETFNPALYEQLVRIGNNGRIAAEGLAITQAIWSAFNMNTPVRLTPENAFEIGYTLRHEGYIDKLQQRQELGMELLPPPDMPPHMLNARTDELPTTRYCHIGRYLPKEAAASAAPAGGAWPEMKSEDAPAKDADNAHGTLASVSITPSQETPESPIVVTIRMRTPSDAPDTASRDQTITISLDEAVKFEDLCAHIRDASNALSATAEPVSIDQAFNMIEARARSFDTGKAGPATRIAPPTDDTMSPG